MIAKGFVPILGIRSFAIMKRLILVSRLESLLPPQAREGRIPRAFVIGRNIVGIYPLFPAGCEPR
jgi:hypothetical protein